MRILACIAFLILFGFNAEAQEISFEQYVTGFSSPTEIANAGDERLFVLERGGLIKIIDKDGAVLSTPFLDIDSIVFDASFQDERGLLGMAFHPDYETNGYFYLNYIDNSSNTNIVRYSRDAADANLADPNTRTEIMTIEQPYGNHNGGSLAFGHDGYLYIGMGDGGSGNDPDNYGQNLQSLLGKMLRIDVDGASPYAVPTDNPFVGDDTTLDEIWSIGLRNPWKFSFDRETGDMWIADVGQNAREEVDFEPAGDPGGHNYGWRCWEGTRFTNNDSQSDCQGDYTDPVYEMLHMGFSGPCSITGGYVYRGDLYDNLKGKYICTDYCSGQIWTITQDGSGGFVGEEVTQFNAGVSTFGQGHDGELYVARLSNGTVYKVVGQLPDVSYAQAESAEYDAANERWLISNGDNIISDDGQGNKKVFSESSASYGMEVMGGFVYGLSPSSLVCVDLTTEEEVFRLQVAGAGFLNGLTNDGQGVLYATDFGNKRIYKIDVTDSSNPTFEILISDTEQTPNGILYEAANNRLLYTTWESNAKVKSVDLASLDQQVLVSTGLGQIDGIDDDSRGNYYLSSWNPDAITRYNSDFTSSEIIATPTLDSPADIGYSQDLDILAIPMGDEVIFVEVEPTSIQDLDDDLQMEIIGNPVTEYCVVQVNLARESDLTFTITDQRGTVVSAIMVNAAAGESFVQLTTTTLVAGLYTVTVSSQEGALRSLQMVKI